MFVIILIKIKKSINLMKLYWKYVNAYVLKVVNNIGILLFFV